MKTIISILFILVPLLIADGHSSELKMKILHNICSGVKNEKHMKVWSDNQKIIDSFKKLGGLNISKSFKDAQLIVLNNKSNLLKNSIDKHIFVLDYDLLEEIPNSFGAFFWKKGRPNIVFIKPRLEEQSLRLSTTLQPYTEDKIW